MEGVGGARRRQNDLKELKRDRKTDEEEQRSIAYTMSQLGSQVRFSPVPEHKLIKYASVSERQP